jgi:hypothetical protein
MIPDERAGLHAAPRKRRVARHSAAHGPVDRATDSGTATGPAYFPASSRVAISTVCLCAPHAATSNQAAGALDCSRQNRP